MEKITLWIKSAAGKISIFLMIMSIIILALACSFWGNFTEKTASNINNILFGLGTNLLGIIVTVSFVQFFLDKQNEKVEYAYEREKILRFDRIMQILIQYYIMYFNTITTPMSQRGSVSPTEIKQQFSFTDMKDFIHSLYFCETKAMSQLSPLSMMLNWNSENTVRSLLLKSISNTIRTF